MLVTYQQLLLGYNTREYADRKHLLSISCACTCPSIWTESSSVILKTNLRWALVKSPFYTRAGSTQYVSVIYQIWAPGENITASGTEGSLTLTTLWPPCYLSSGMNCTWGISDRGYMCLADHSITLDHVCKKFLGFLLLLLWFGSGMYPKAHRLKA